MQQFIAALLWQAVQVMPVAEWRRWTLAQRHLAKAMRKE